VAYFLERRGFWEPWAAAWRTAFASAWRLGVAHHGLGHYEVGRQDAEAVRAKLSSSVPGSARPH
jgi:hypothetical protein